MSKFSESLYKLSVWYLKNARDLPWRRDPSPYNVWVSEIMLQQTTVAAVVPYYEKFISRFPGVKSLSEAPQGEVLRYWAGLGYYSRAQNMHRAAGIIARNGSFPETREGWLDLPGIGEYTAGAILSIAFNRPEPILDANVRRIIARLRMLKAEINKKIFWKWSKLIAECANRRKIAPGIINQSLMELGALVCTVSNPFCGECVLSGICKAFKTGNVEKYPGKIKKRWMKMHEDVFCLINQKHEVLLELHHTKRWRKGLWDFPSDAPEAVKQDKTRESAVMKSRYIITNHKIKRDIHIYHVNDPVKALNGPFRWVPLSSSDNLPVAVGSPIRKALVRINEFIKKERRLPDGD